ncbi:Exodeoxyribonuclease 7 large subunit [compost metagenome]
MRAATPTAAAELAVPHQAELLGQIKQQQNALNRLLQGKLQQAKISYRRLRQSPVLLHPKRSLMQHMERLDVLDSKLRYLLNNHVSLRRSHYDKLHHQLLRYHPAQTFQTEKRRHIEMTRHLGQAANRTVAYHARRLSSTIRHLDALSPLKVMERGYSLVYDEQESKLVKSIDDIHPGDLITVKVMDGDLSCQVRGMERKRKGESNGTGDQL